MHIDVYRMIDDGARTTGWYAKGNHTLEEIIDGVEYENDVGYFEPDEIAKFKVYHTYFRCVPVSKFDDLPFSHWLHESKPGRGAFEVSVIYYD